MKLSTLLFTAGLVSAQLNIANTPFSNIKFENLREVFNLGDLNLSDLQVGGLNLGNLDLTNQNVVAEAILAMLRNFCLGNALDLNAILNLGIDNELDLLFQLAQLQQFAQLGFLDLFGIQQLFNRGLILNGFNLGEYPATFWRQPLKFRD